jgi:hypothetical protein
MSVGVFYDFHYDYRTFGQSFRRNCLKMSTSRRGGNRTAALPLGYPAGAERESPRLLGAQEIAQPLARDAELFLEC